MEVEASGPRDSAQTQTLLLAGVCVIAALYFGQEILVPLALAFLLSFVLAPLTIRLDRLGLGRIPSVLIVVSILFVLLGTLGLVVASQVSDLASNLPRYERALEQKIRNLQLAMPEGGVLERATEAFHKLQREIERTTTQAETPAGPPMASGSNPPAEEKPVPVAIREVATSPFETMTAILMPVLAPLGTAGLVLVFVIFMLIEREDLRDRLIRLGGTKDLSRTTEAMNDAAKRVSGYLLAQLVINATYGLAVGVGCWAIGIPNPLLWGLLGTILRFIPYLGPILAAFFPIVLSVAVESGFQTFLLTAGLFVVLELFINNVMEPWLYGSSTGISTLAILIAAVFWTTLWGPVGLLLSVPLTVCLVVLGRHVPQLEFLEVLLGSESPLPVEAKIYQRLLADDRHEASEEAEDAADERGLEAFYEEVLVPVLSLALQDRRREAISVERAAKVAEGVRDIAEEAAELAAAVEKPEMAEETDAGVAGAVEPTEIELPAGPVTLCIGARHVIDDAAAEMLAQLLARAGIAARPVASSEVGAQRLASLQLTDVDAVVLCYVSPATLQHAQRTVRRFRLRFGRRHTIIVAALHARRELLDANGFKIEGADELTRTLDDAIDALRRVRAPNADAPASLAA